MPDDKSQPLPRLAIANAQAIASVPGVPANEQATFAPCFLSDPDSAIPEADALLMAQTALFRAQVFPKNDLDGKLTDPNRTGDTIRLWIHRKGGDWEPYIIERWPHQGTNVVIANHMTFPWMQDEEFLRDHPESYVDGVRAPSLFKLGGVYRCLFVGVIGDPSVFPTRIGVAYQASSRNAIDWTLENPNRDHPNIALRYAMLWSQAPSLIEQPDAPTVIRPGGVVPPWRRR